MTAVDTNKASALDKPLSDRRERFVQRYLVDFDRLAALRDAGYEFATDDIGNTMASRMLSCVKVRAYMMKLKAEYASAYKMDAVMWLNHLRLVAMDAYEDGKWSEAVGALREIGKHLGCYLADNRQKHFTAEDADKLRADLEARGFDFARRNAPPTLVNDAEAPVVIPPPPENP